MSSLSIPDFGMRGPQAALERKLIEEYLRSKGYCLHDLGRLPRAEAKKLMIETCAFATARLAEVESRAKFQQKIHFG